MIVSALFTQYQKGCPGGSRCRKQRRWILDTSTSFSLSLSCLMSWLNLWNCLGWCVVGLQFVSHNWRRNQAPGTFGETQSTDDLKADVQIFTQTLRPFCQFRRTNSKYDFYLQMVKKVCWRHRVWRWMEAVSSNFHLLVYNIWTQGVCCLILLLHTIADLFPPSTLI